MKVEHRNGNTLIINKYIPFKGFVAINLFGLVFIREENYKYFTDYSLNHERIHTQQLLECGIIFYYPLYLLEWFIKLFFYWKKSYDHISFEIEAKENMYNLNYISNRKHYSWLKKIFK